MTNIPDLVPRAQLPLPHPYVAPRTPTERSLADIWRGVLGMDRVGVDDGYHDLGGDSFLAGLIFARIREAFDIDMPLSVLATSPTVALLAARIDRLAPR